MGFERGIYPFVRKVAGNKLGVFMIVTALSASVSGQSSRVVAGFFVDESTLLVCTMPSGEGARESLLSVKRVLLTQASPQSAAMLGQLLGQHKLQQGPGVSVYCLSESMEALCSGAFDKIIPPDYLLPVAVGKEPLLRFNVLEVGDTLALSDGMATALPAQQKIASIGWLIEGPWRAIAYTGVSAPCLAFWHWIANAPSLSDVVCEVANNEAPLSDQMTPATLLPMLELLPPNVHIWIHPTDILQRDLLLATFKARAPQSLNIAEFTVDSLIDL